MSTATKPYAPDDTVFQNGPSRQEIESKIAWLKALGPLKRYRLKSGRHSEQTVVTRTDEKGKPFETLEDRDYKAGDIFESYRDLIGLLDRNNVPGDGKFELIPDAAAA